MERDCSCLAPSAPRRPVRRRVMRRCRIRPGSTTASWATAPTRSSRSTAVRGSTSSASPAISPCWRRKHTVIFYDQRGGGKSTLPTDTSTLVAARQVQDLDELRRHFGLATCDARRALVRAAARGVVRAGASGDHVKRMVFFGPVPPRRGDFWQRFGQELGERASITRSGPIGRVAPRDRSRPLRGRQPAGLSRLLGDRPASSARRALRRRSRWSSRISARPTPNGHPLRQPNRKPRDHGFVR